MPFLFLLILTTLPVLDALATFRLAELCNVPGVSLFIPGLVLGLWMLRRESRRLRTQLVPALAELTLPALMFDSARRMLAGILFMMPGVVSDLLAVVLLTMPARLSPATAPPAPRRSTVVNGEYRRLD
ncbi:MAG: FxsA family protein [Casimicrobiaceae bacterium]